MEKTDKEKLLEERVKQLEESMRLQKLFIPQEPDTSLAEDEWYAIFSNYENKIEGRLTKIQPTILAGNMSMFKVKKID